MAGPGTLDGLPDVLAGRWIKQLRDAIVAARAGGRPVLAAIGGHVIKTGCAPYLNDWIARGVLTGAAMNGSAAIHDPTAPIEGLVGYRSEFRSINIIITCKYYQIHQI